MGEPVEVNIFSHQGGLRDLATFSPADIDALPEAQRTLFLDLRAKQERCAKIEMERRAVSQEIRKTEILLDDLHIARDKEHPRPTFNDIIKDAREAYKKSG